MGLAELTRAQETILWSKAAGMCSKCKSILIKKGREEFYKKGENAHIEGKEPKAARYNSNQTDEERASYLNHILLCADCHTDIDKDPKSYPNERLLEIKHEHESWISQQLSIESNNLTFAELEVIHKFLIPNSVHTSGKTLEVITPEQKIVKNNISNTIAKYITIGMLQYGLVKKYINENPDVNFGDRLREGFVNQYSDLAKLYEGDELFNELWDFASGYSSEFSIKAAGLSVLTYFFQICDVFES